MLEKELEWRYKFENHSQKNFSSQIHLIKVLEALSTFLDSLILEVTAVVVDDTPGPAQDGQGRPPEERLVLAEPRHLLVSFKGAL